MTAQESNNLVIESPYPRTVGLMGGDLRPKPKPIGIRLAADFWTLLIGFSYSLLSLLTHWSVIVILVIAFAWRAFRVERMKVDFAPRTIALALAAWVPAGLLSRFDLVLDEAVASPSEPNPGPEQQIFWGAFYVFVLLVALWGIAIAWRRLTRAELAPGGFYEGWRSGITWFLLPAILFYYAEAVGLLRELNPSIVVLTILAFIGVGSVLLWQTKWERIATSCAGILLFSLFITASTYLPNVFDGWGPTALQDKILVGSAISLIGAVILTVIYYRDKNNLVAEPKNQFVASSEEK